jgi:hypothetical protein
MQLLRVVRVIWVYMAVLEEADTLVLVEATIY